LLPTPFVASDRSRLFDRAQRIRQGRFRLVRPRQFCRKRPRLPAGRAQASGPARFQRSRIDLIGRHHGQDHRIGQKSGQRQLAVIHRGAFGTGVEIG